MNFVYSLLECFEIAGHSNEVPIQRPQFEFVVVEIIAHCFLISLVAQVFAESMDVKILSKPDQLRIPVFQGLMQLLLHDVQFSLYDSMHVLCA